MLLERGSVLENRKKYDSWDATGLGVPIEAKTASHDSVLVTEGEGEGEGKEGSEKTNEKRQRVE